MNNLTYKEYIKLLELKKDGKLNKPIFIDFYADWWGPCRIFKQVLDIVSSELSSEVDFYKVDIDKELELANEFSVRSVPHLIFMRNNDKADSYHRGTVDIDTLRSWIKSRLL